MDDDSLSSLARRLLPLIRRAIGARVISAVTQNIPTATNTALTFDTEVEDTDGLWDVSAPTRLTAPLDGYYLAGGAWTLGSAQNSAASTMHAYVREGASNYLAAASLHTIAGRDARLSVATGMIWLAAGEYIEVVAYHDEGSTKTASAAGLTSQYLCNGWLQML